MGTYVYALNTKIHTISNVTVGVAEYRYKESWSDDKLSAKMHQRTCGRREAYFDSHKLPFFYVLSKLEEGTAVFSQQSKDGSKVVGCSFYDTIKHNKVGTLTKVGRSWTINWI